MKTLGIICACVLLALPAAATVIWNEDFSDVSDWSVISNPSNDASVATDGSHGLFSEPSPGLAWPNGSAFGPTNRIAFDPSEASRYALGFTVTAISGSMSYDLAFDCFSNGSYVATVWDVFPNQAFTGTTNISLGSFSFNPATTEVSPKLTLHTGNGEQTVSFDSMSLDQSVVPEPASAALFALAGAVALVLRRRGPR